MIRRKSDAQPQPPKYCAYHQQMLIERANQRLHERRQFDMLSTHDQRAACWCCCEDCTDLQWTVMPEEGG